MPSFYDELPGFLELGSWTTHHIRPLFDQFRDENVAPALALIIFGSALMLCVLFLIDSTFIRVQVRRRIRAVNADVGQSRYSLIAWWNPAVEDQCTDRVYRIGQDRTVHIYYPMAVHPLYGESSFDALLNALLSRKRDLSRRMLLPPVNAKQDQNWFAENIGREAPEAAVVLPINIDDIDAMEPLAFERWALGRCISLGWEASRTPRSYDGGADGILLHRLSGARAIVQCKHTQSDNNACGPEAIDDLLRARTNYVDPARLFVLTNARQFSRTAHERAERHGITLIGRNELPHWPRHLLSS